MLPEPIASGLDRFQVLSRLGQGGMGTVYAVFDRVRATRMALKTVGPAGGKALLRFKREFRAICEIRHPNIVRLGELFEVQGAWYYTMELVDGLDFVTYARARTDETTSRTDPDSDGSNPSGLRRAYQSESDPRNAGALQADTKLRHALGQLVDALRVLHEHERVHRDVKPSNVLVTREGRVVLLDFGLVADRGEDSDVNEVAGTIAYMAPEQADAKPAGPEADFYAVGVMLYEALTGTLPFAGESASVLVQKSKGTFRSPSELSDELPADLVALCVSLLSSAPGQRPTARDILARLRGEAAHKTLSERPPDPVRAPFSGRKKQLEVLEQAFAATREKLPRALLLRAPSGFGKTSLVEHFLAELRAREGNQLLILRGRCRQYEEVSFNAFDAVIDTLSGVIPSWQRLRGVLSRDQIAAMQRAFPVLERVPGQGQIDLQRADVKQLRVALHEGLRGLLRVFSATRHVVIALDDMQWADAESWSLLHELTREPDPPAVLVVLTGRSELRAENLASDDGARVLSQAISDVIDLPPLDEAESRELTAKLADVHALDAQAIENLVRDGSGNPMLLTTMLLSGLSETSSAPRLSDVLLHQVRQQSPEGRAIIDAVCLASAPIGRTALARALSQSPAAVTAAVDIAIDARLLRFSGASAKSPIEPYHDQIRQAVLGTILEPRRHTLHRTLALSLEAEDDAREQALYHYREAADHQSLARCAEAAGDHAMTALAFERALRLFDEALAALPEGDEKADALRRKRADALSHAGRGLEAAEAYLALVASAPADEALELRRSAAAHLLSAAEVTRGKQVLGDVMHDLGLALPQTTAGALMRALWLRARLRVRGMGIVVKAERKPDSRTLARLETCASSAYMFSVLDPILGTYLSCLHAVHALSAGDFEHALRALSTEGGYRCLVGNQEDGLALMKRANDMSSADISPRLKATLTASDAAIAWALSDFRRALKLARDAHRLFSTKCQQVTWELVTLELVEITSLFFLGNYHELSRRVPICLRAAEGRADRYGTTNMLVSQASVRFLAADDATGALMAVDQGMKIWPSTGFDMHHLMALQVRVYAHLYAGEIEKARATFADAERALNKSFLLRLTAYRVLAFYIECQVLLADQSWRSDATVARRLRSLAKKLSQLRSPLSQAFASCVELVLSWSDAEGRERHLTKALERLELSGLNGHAAALRLRAAESGQLSTERERAFVSSGLSFLLEQRVSHPERFIRCLVPPLSTA
jgi:serine/threonine protein kinase/tetratricopeptide (TPR) repeat protein